MSSTNKTTNYELSQFLGTDKPAWLQDYNSDMGKIDAQMKLNADGVTAASGSASTANTAIGTLSNLTTDVKTDLVSAINEVDGHADTAQNTANLASNTANANTTKIGNIESYFNINNFTTPSPSATGATISSSNLSCASNTDGSLGKIYGTVVLTSTSTTSTITFATPLRPDSAITVNGIVIAQYDDSRVVGGSVSIGTDGTATFTISGTVNGRIWRIYFMASVIFAKSFGDTPIDQ